MADKYLKYLQGENSDDRHFFLPIVTGKQDGKALKVVNGKWKMDRLIPLSPGLYDANEVMLASWDELVNDYGMNIHNAAYERWGPYDYTESPYNVLKNESLVTGITLVIDPSITSISAGAFYGCSGLTSVIIPEGITIIEDSIFYECTALTSVNIPESVTTINIAAFKYCTSLASINIPNSIYTIRNHAFYGCSNLNSIIIPESVYSIQLSVFYGCTGLTSVTFEGTPNTIKADVFDGCTNLTDIYVPWSEGAVANAPWGATNATIHYNHTA